MNWALFGLYDWALIGLYLGSMSFLTFHAALWLEGGLQCVFLAQLLTLALALYVYVYVPG